MKAYTAYTKNENGAVRLYVNEKRCAPIIYGLSDIPASRTDTAQAQRNIKNFAKVGIDIVQVDTGIHIGWKRNGHFDITPIEKEVQGAVNANPTAKVIIRLHMNPPYWWLKKYPKECVTYGDVQAIDGGEYVRMITGDDSTFLRASIASEKWLIQASRILKQVCRELSITEAGKHVIGIQVAYGAFGEWHHFGWNYNPDYSIPVTKRFRKFIKQKYKTNAKLQEVWGMRDVTFDTANLASVEKRDEAHWGTLRDPLKSQYVLDSLKVHQVIVAEAICRFARIVKENWPRDILVGAFYTYFFCIKTPDYTGGHLEVDMVHSCPDIDFLAAPNAYMQNRPITGSPLPRGLLESARINGKLWLTEMDQAPIGTDKEIGGTPENRGESIALMRRNIMDTVIRGAGSWYYDHRIVPSGDLFHKNGWWDHPELLRDIHKMQLIADKVKDETYIPVADVAIVYDTEVTYYLPKNPIGEPGLEYMTPHAVGHSGVMYDYIYLKDLFKADIERYKCIIFVNTYLLNTETKEFINSKLKKDGKHLVFIGPIGILDSEFLNERYVCEVSNMELKQVPDSKNITVLGDTVEFYHKPSPIFAVNDFNAQQYGTLEDGSIGVAVKNQGDWTSWYLSAPSNSIKLYKEIFNRSGVHTYSDKEDVVVAGNGMVMIVAINEGERIIRLKNGKTVKINIPEKTTIVLNDKNGERIL